MESVQVFMRTNSVSIRPTAEVPVSKANMAGPVVSTHTRNTPASATLKSESRRMPRSSPM